MITKGSLVRFVGERHADEEVYNGKLLSVAERRGDELTVYTRRAPKGKWHTTTVAIGDVVEVR